MNEDKPLINPSIQDFEHELESEYLEDKVPVLKDQIQLGVGNPRLSPATFIKSIKFKVKKRAEIMEFSTLWRDPAIPFSITSAIATVIVILGGTILSFNEIPPKIPFLFNAASNRWEQFDKSLMFVFPILLLAMELTVVHLAIKLFQHDKKLAISISWMIVFLNILLLIAIGQIFTLVT
jgi:hypothetical protein